jgi:hypothetical protein
MRYIYGSADVVGLMCLKVFVSGQDNKYEELKVKPCAWSFKSKLLTWFKDDNLLKSIIISQVLTWSLLMKKPRQQSSTKSKKTLE